MENIVVVSTNNVHAVFHQYQQPAREPAVENVEIYLSNICKQTTYDNMYRIVFVEIDSIDFR